MSEPLTDSQLYVMRQGCDSEMGKALDEIDRLKSLLQCGDCHGNGTRWYALHGMDTCQKCRGTGERQ